MSHEGVRGGGGAWRVPQQHPNRTACTAHHTHALLQFVIQYDVHAKLTYSLQLMHIMSKDVTII